jgi:hypothetical protein
MAQIARCDPADRDKIMYNMSSGNYSYHDNDASNNSNDDTY